MFLNGSSAGLDRPFPNRQPINSPFPGMRDSCWHVTLPRRVG